MSNKNTKILSMSATSYGSIYKSGDAIVNAHCPYCEKVIVVRYHNGIKDVAQSCPHYVTEKIQVYPDGKKNYIVYFKYVKEKKKIKDRHELMGNLF